MLVAARCKGLQCLIRCVLLQRNAVQPDWSAYQGLYLRVKGDGQVRSLLLLLRSAQHLCLRLSDSSCMSSSPAEHCCCVPCGQQPSSVYSCSAAA